MSRSNWTDDKLLFRLINNRSGQTRWDNIRVLHSRPSEELFSKCLELVSSKDPKRRMIGIDILAQLGNPRPLIKQTIKLFFELLHTETDPEVLMSLLSAIGHNNDNLSKSQIERLCSFLDNNDSRVKEGLVFSLGGIDDLNAIKALIKLSADKHSHIRDWATFGIGSLVKRNNKSIREALWNRVNDTHQNTKLEAIVGLAIRKEVRVNEIIKRELLAGEYGTLIFEAIIELGDKDFLPLLRQNLKAARSDKSIDPEWLKDLESCIKHLKNLGDKKNDRTTF